MVIVKKKLVSQKLYLENVFLSYSDLAPCCHALLLQFVTNLGTFKNATKKGQILLKCTHEITIFSALFFTIH